MPKFTAVMAASDLALEDDAPPCLGAQIVDLDDVAHRRERLAAYVDATRQVIVYRFIFPDGARVASLGAGGALRDPRDQLQLVVGLTGGGLAKSHGGLAARIPTTLASRFETLARPLIEAFLVSLDLGEAASAPNL